MSRRLEGLRHDAAAATARALDVPGDRLEAALEDGSALSTAWARLSPVARSLLPALAHLGGAASEEVLAAELAAEAEDRERDDLPGDPDRARERAAAELERAWERGLIQRERGSGAYFLHGPLARAVAARAETELRDQLDEIAAPPQAVDGLLQRAAGDRPRVKPAVQQMSWS